MICDISHDTTSGAAVADTPEKIELVKILSIKARLKIEAMTGMKHSSGVSALKLANEVMGTKFKKKLDCLKALEAYIKEKYAKKDQAPDWSEVILHAVLGEDDYAQNVHTHGLTPDLQIVLPIRPDVAAGWLYTLYQAFHCAGKKIETGKKYNMPEYFQGGYEFEFVEVYESGRKVMRVLVPDKENKTYTNPAEETANPPYSQQAFLKTS